jgi:hypothetical protein
MTPLSAARLAMEPLRLERLEKLASLLPSGVAPHAQSVRKCEVMEVLAVSFGTIAGRRLVGPAAATRCCLCPRGEISTISSCFSKLCVGMRSRPFA